MLRERKETFMKKPTKEPSGELRPKYERSDFLKLVRGKYVSRLRKCPNVIIPGPESLEPAANCPRLFPG